MVALAVLIVGAWLQWKAYRFCVSYATSGASPEVGKAFRDLAHRDPDALSAWAKDLAASPWEATGELPVVRPGDGAVDTQLRLGET